MNHITSIGLKTSIKWTFTRVIIILHKHCLWRLWQISTLTDRGRCLEMLSHLKMIHTHWWTDRPEQPFRWFDFSIRNKKDSIKEMYWMETGNARSTFWTNLTQLQYSKAKCESVKARPWRREGVQNWSILRKKNVGRQGDEDLQEGLQPVPHPGGGRAPQNW